MLQPAREFSERYLKAAADCLKQLSAGDIAKVSRVLLDAYERGAQVFIIGNGGSAALASHFACDLAKTVLGKNIESTSKRFRAISLCDNVAVMTAWANDVAYERIFSEQLKALAQPGDVLLVITGSGNSPNVLEAVRMAKSLGLHTIGWLGFDGGKARAQLDDYILVPVHDYGLVEAGHDVLAHLITAWLMAAVAAERKAA